MATSPSEPVPPEVIALAVAMAVAMLDTEAMGGGGGGGPVVAAVDDAAWRWQGWD